MGKKHKAKKLKKKNIVKMIAKLSSFEKQRQKKIYEKKLRVQEAKADKRMTEALRAQEIKAERRLKKALNAQAKELSVENNFIAEEISRSENVTALKQWG